MIALVNPWSTPSPKKPLPMPMLALGSMLEGEFDYTIVDGNLERDVLARLEAIDAATPLQICAITVMLGPQLTHAVPLSRAVKARWPGLPIVWGGYFPSQHADTCLGDPAVDVCVFSQGEQTFVELARVLTRGGSLAGVAGIAYRDDAGIHHTARRHLTPLDELPDWRYDRVDMEQYLHSHYLGTRVGGHQSSFGCAYGCSFCAIVELSGRRWLAQSPARVGAAIEHLHGRYGIDAVQFYDMDFFINEARTADIAGRMQRLGLAWWALGRVDELMRYDTRTWRQMKASGLKMVFCGAESGSTATLKQMNKGGTMKASMTMELVKRAKSFGIVPELSFVVGNPPDPMADLDNTLQYIRELKAANPATEIILYTYTPVPQKGGLYEEAKAQGFEFPQTLDDWVSDRWRSFAMRRDPRTPWLNDDVKTRVRNFETVMNAYYPTVTDTRLTSWRRSLLRAVAAWRFHTGTFNLPLELNALQRAFHYQRPETTGF
jgi:radical SAM superfamily enzyme YgiQ (UPF0313 family)